MSSSKLPKDIIMMIEKNNLVIAIKTLANDKGISIEEAKSLVDEYEEKLRAKREKKVNVIAKKQGINIKKLNTKTKENSVNELNAGLNARLNKIGYERPLLPRWLKRVALIMIIMTIVFYIIWSQLA